MKKEPQHYPVLYLIFALLNSVRRGILRKNIWRRPQLCVELLQTNSSSMQADPKPVHGHWIASECAVQEVDQSTIPPLQHKRTRLEEIARADLDLHFDDHAFIPFGDVIAEVFELFLAQVNRQDDRTQTRLFGECSR